MACNIRAPIRKFADGAKPAAHDATRKTNNPQKNNFFLPYRSASQPETSSNDATPIVYALIIQDSLLSDASGNPSRS